VHSENLTSAHFGKVQSVDEKAFRYCCVEETSPLNSAPRRAFAMNIALGYAEIAAPIDGMVGERGVRAGQYVGPGVQVISVVRSTSA
jgi:multidrug resistance efflux pump